MNINWQFDRGKFDPELGVTPIRLHFLLGDDAAQTEVTAIITEDAAKRMLADLQTVASGLDVVSTVPTNGAGS